jgi:xanthine dehydrogenase YagT iron-sulfur-binding subunit
MDSHEVTRREFVGTVIAGGAAAAALPGVADAQGAAAPPHTVSCTLTINGQSHLLTIDSRVTLLDLLREHLRFTGTKKGCGHGQCGACTVLVNGQRINSCMTFAVMHEGDQITTIEGLGQPGSLHPMQAAFIEHDGFQCGYCTPGQICSAVAMLQEVKAGSPSVLTPGIHIIHPIDLTDEEIRERMSGNICRCGAYPNIVDAIRMEARRTGPPDIVQREDRKGQSL